MKQTFFNLVRTNSVLKPSEQSPTLLHFNNEGEKKVIECINAIMRDTNLSVDLKAYLVLLYETGIRISELLKINHSRVSVSGKIYINGSKGSSDRVVNSSYYNDYWITKRNCNYLIGDIYSRNYFYRLMKKKGLILFGGYGKNNAVTHSGRYLNVQNINTLTNNLEITKNYIGHKSKNSTIIYLKSKKK